MMRVVAGYELRLDRANDVLYALRNGAEVFSTRESTHDADVIVRYNRAGDVVGVILRGASWLTPGEWRTHPGRRALSAELLDALDVALGA